MNAATLQKSDRIGFPYLVPTYTALWSIWNFLWICAVFYMSYSHPSDWSALGGAGFAAWGVGLIAGLLALILRARALRTAIHRLFANRAAHDDRAALALLRRLLAFPAFATTIYAVIWFVVTAVYFGYWIYAGYSVLSAMSVWVGGVAGGIACPALIYGAISLVAGPATEQVSAECVRRNLDLRRTRAGLRLKQSLAVILFAVGYTVWLGGLGFYTTLRGIVSKSTADLTEYHNMLIHSENGSAARTESTRTAYLKQVQDFERVFGFPAPRAFSGKSGSVYDGRRNALLVWTSASDGRLLVSVASTSYDLTNVAPVYGIWLGVFTFAAMIVAGTLAFTYSTAVLRSIEAVYDMVHRLGEGDVSRRRGAQSLDEAGMTAVNVHRFLDSLAEKIRHIREVSRSVSNEMNALSQTAYELSNGAQTQASAVEEASATMEEVASTTKEIQSMVEDQSRRVSAATQAVEEELGASIERLTMQASVVNDTARESVTRADQARNVSLSSIEGMQNIEASSDDILHIVDVITGIAEKTNLLALNASIEAARAGEFGRGFAVVADEVSKLADQSGSAIKEIRHLVDVNRARVAEGAKLTRGLDTAVEEMRKSAELAQSLGEEMGKITQGQARTSEGIRTNIHELSDTARSIARAGAEEAATTTEMARTLDQINDVAQGTARNADTIAESVSRLDLESRRLNEVAESFVLSADEQT